MPGIHIELKAAKDITDDELKVLPEKALKQFDNKKYDTELTTKGVMNMFKYGLVFSEKEVKILRCDTVIIYFLSYKPFQLTIK